MRTTIDIDPALLEKVVAVTGEKSKGRAVDRAMEEFLRRRAIARLVELAGTGAIKFRNDFEERHEKDLELELEHRRDTWGGK